MVRLQAQTSKMNELYPLRRNLNRNRASQQKKGNGWTVLATRVCGRLNNISRRERLRTSQRRSSLRKHKRRPYRPSPTALGLIRPFIQEIENSDITIKTSPNKFRLSSETRKSIRPFKWILIEKRLTFSLVYKFIHYPYLNKLDIRIISAQEIHYTYLNKIKLL